MCLRIGGGGGGPMPVPQPIQPRLANDRVAKAEPLPDDKDLLDPDEVADVSFGKNKKPETTATRKTGTQALKIPVNVTSQGSNINV
tara:strand:- start:658 stop:915 length:258 start_codon:yes stop_codon:yes gene_type:complete